MLLDQINSAQLARRIEVDPFIYVATWNTLGATTTAAVTVSIQTDSDFVLVKQHLVAFTAAGVLLPPPPDYLIQFTDLGSGRNLQDQPVHVGNIMGPDAGHPWYLVEPKMIKGGTLLQVTLQNLTGVAARVDVALCGFKVFYYPGYSRANLFVG